MDRQQVDKIQEQLLLYGRGPLYIVKEGEFFQIISSGTGEIIFTTSNEDRAKSIITIRETIDLWLEDIEAMTSSAWKDMIPDADKEDAYYVGFNHAIAAFRRYARLYLPEPKEKEKFDVVDF